MDNAILAALAAAGWALALPGWMLFLLRPNADGTPLIRKRAIVIPPAPEPEERAQAALRAQELEHASSILFAGAEESGRPITWESARAEAERLLQASGLWGQE